MMRRNKPVSALSQQMERRSAGTREKKKRKEYDGDDSLVISTGSTLLDLAISGGRFREGGLPAGILVEIFGPSGSGKTVLLCQIAGNVQKRNGSIMFHDPEARLNKQFAKMFHLNTDDIEYSVPDTVPEVFQSVRDWAPEEGLNGVFADSLAALSTDMEMDESKGDKMGMRRAKEFSEETRKTCRIITKTNLLMVCSNQVRQNLDAGPYGQKYTTPGGEAIGFYASLRLRCMNPKKIKEKKKVKGKEHTRVIGVETEIEVFKSSVWKPFYTATVYIVYDYGIDDIRGNLRFLKTNTGKSVYELNGQNLGKSLNEAIKIVEKEGLEHELKEAVIDLWNEIEGHFEIERKPKV